MGLVGMIQNMIDLTLASPKVEINDVDAAIASGKPEELAQAISAIENSQGELARQTRSYPLR